VKSESAIHLVSVLVAQKDKTQNLLFRSAAGSMELWIADCGIQMRIADLPIRGLAHSAKLKFCHERGVSKREPNDLRLS
jgi:hypothetical protein